MEKMCVGLFLSPAELRMSAFELFSSLDCEFKQMWVHHKFPHFSTTHSSNCSFPEERNSFSWILEPLCGYMD